jgi:hypothetical protein
MASPRHTATVAPGGGPARLLSYGDESMRTVPRSATAVYILAAAIVAEDRCATVRDQLRPMVRRGQGQLHWRDEHQARREAIAKTLAMVGVDSVVVIGTMIETRKQERARRLLLGHLLGELDRRQVAALMLESRHPERDRHDLKAVGGFRNQRRVSRRLVVGHTRPVQEPLLWVPDAVAGAVGDDRVGQPTCLRLLTGLVEVLDVGSIT